MKWVRCPKCRTVNDIDRYAMCDGCNADLAGVPATPDPQRQQVQRIGERDTRSSRRVLWVIAFIALGSTFVLPPFVSMISALVSFIMLVILFMNFGLQSVWGSRMGTLLKAAGTLVAIAAALGGAFILVAIACSAGLRLWL